MNRRTGVANSPRRLAKPGVLARLRILVRVALAVLMLGGIGWGGQWLYRALDTRVEVISVEIANVEAVSGERRRQPIARQEIEAMVMGAMTGGFLSLDLATIRDALEAHPWIESARVRRTWGKGLAISFVEETPIARWGDKAFLSRSGVVLAVDDGAALDNLLHLSGPPGSEREVMREYRDIARLLQPAGLKISKLAIDSRGSWSTEIEGGPRLLLGRDQIPAKIGRFLAVWNLVLQARRADVALIDARYDGGLAVQWRKTDAAG